MRVHTILSALIGAAAFLTASAVPLAQHAEPISNAEVLRRIEERQAASVAVTGVTVNGAQPRRELRVLQQQYGDTFNLYLLGLQRFMAVSQSDPLSYYQIAGIHGRPYNTWDGAVSPAGSGGYGGGYCTHTSNLFLPWHRPYLALFEQVLYTHVQAVAKTFPSSAGTRWTSAAANFRIPYWDWAAAPCANGCHYFPILVSQQTVSVTTPSGQQTIPNPLYQYSFHSISVADMVYNPFASWNATKRNPQLNGANSWDVNSVSNNNAVATQIQAAQPGYADRVYSIMQYTNFTLFGTEARTSSDPANVDSLESIHDALHNTLGSNGHMTYLDYSAFDPIFFLHHVQVDRLFAMFQVLQPKSYVLPLKVPGSSYMYPAGTLETATSWLSPFHNNAKGGQWNSTGVVSTRTFGYYYPETSSGATAASVRSAVKSLYGGSSATSTISSKSKRSTVLGGALSKLSKRVFKRDLVGEIATALGIQQQATGSRASYEYSASIVSQKFQLNGSYAIHLFLGNPPDDCTQWPTAPNLVGTHGVFANYVEDGQENPMGGSDLLVTGAVPLTSGLIAEVNQNLLSGLKPELVEPYLTKNLQWRCSKYDGTEVAISDVPDLSITVVSSLVEPATADDEFPSYGNWQGMPNVTWGQPGGHHHNYWSSPKAQYSRELGYSLGGNVRIGLNIGH